MEVPISIETWPRAILHLDADAFFASCEQAIHPDLKGRPVVTGKERGIVAAASYEAKAAGVRRGMRISEARRVCPEAVIIPSDYETYSLFSVRMFDILRRFSPDVEEYSIDEAFVDLTGLRRRWRLPYGGIAKVIQETVERELGITVSVGVSLSKVLAKVASRHRKPHGLTVIPGREIHRYLHGLPVGEVWGIGPNTAALLKKLGITTALEFARADKRVITKHLSRPYQEIWQELNGRSVYPVSRTARGGYQSISKAKTFTPPCSDAGFLFAQLSKNLEAACIKARRHHLAATRLMVFLRTQDFRDAGVQMRLSRPTAYPAELFGALREGFNALFYPDQCYRQTGVVLAGLVEASGIQYGLFEDTGKIERMERIYEAIDLLSERFGKYTVHHGSSLPTMQQARHRGERGELPQRQGELIKGENRRQRLGIPMLYVKV